MLYTFKQLKPALTQNYWQRKRSNNNKKKERGEQEEVTREDMNCLTKCKVNMKQQS